MEFQHQFKQYAELAVQIGINIQEGQTLVVSAPIETAEFVREVIKSAYAAGAKDVMVEWSDEEAARLKYELAPEAALQEYPRWKAAGMEQMSEEGAAFLTVYAPNPDLLSGLDPKRIATANKARSAALQKATAYKTSFKVSWSMVSVPTPSWAAKLFPDLPQEQQIAKLWENIFYVNRMDQPDPVTAWKQHINKLNQRADFLNEQRFKQLHYRAPGTNLTIALPPHHHWVSAGNTNKDDVFFVPNIPTEEVFTLPSKEGVNGTVSSTMPLNYGGSLIDNFKLTFENGKIIDYSAEQGYEALKHLIETDEGSHYLGEVALVPYHSPISDLNFIFFNTLYDENASCHLAIGFSYPFNLQGGTAMSREQLEALGANQSLVHVDFMMGAAEMEIDGETEDGSRLAIFRAGDWVI